MDKDMDIIYLGKEFEPSLMGPSSASSSGAAQQPEELEAKQRTSEEVKAFWDRVRARLQVDDNELEVFVSFSTQHEKGRVPKRNARKRSSLVKQEMP
jgi:hypothetical protein